MNDISHYKKASSPFLLLEKIICERKRKGHPPEKVPGK